MHTDTLYAPLKLKVTMPTKWTVVQNKGYFLAICPFSWYKLEALQVLSLIKCHSVFFFSIPSCFFFFLTTVGGRVFSKVSGFNLM